MKEETKKLVRSNYQQVILVAVAFMAMVLVSYFYVSEIVSEQTFEIGEVTMDTIETAVSGSLAEAELSFANIAQTVDTMLAAGNTNEEILEYITGINVYFTEERSPLPDFMKIYGYIRDEFLDGSGWVPPGGYEPWERPWYIGAENNAGKIYFSEPYIDAETGGMCISFSQEVFDSANISKGVLAIDLKLSRITDYVASQKIANDGYGVLVSDAMAFTAHRDPGLIGVEVDEAGGDYPRLAQMMEDGEPIAAEHFIDADGTDSIGFFRTIFNGWNIGVIIPRASYFEPLYQLGTVLLILGAVLAAVLSYILVRTRAAKMRSDEESMSKSTFLARMSHEMRTPMNAIIGMTGIARKTRDIEKIEYCLSKIDDAANHLLGVINDVLDMSKIAAGKLELSETNFQFQKMLDQALTVTGFKIEEKHQNFTVKVDEDVPACIVSDRQRLAQVIANLLSNANKFTPEGGDISLSVHRVEDQDGKCRLKIEVKDNGIGISKEQQARLFRSFEQADGSISREYGGTGLGLAISKKIIEMMNGEAWIESEPGEGSNFIFTVLVGVGSAEACADSVQADTAQEDGAGIFSGKRILLAEDMQLNREVLTAMLEDTGVTIDCAEDGEKAVDMFAANPETYDMIFMDIHMPKVDGYEATRRIRASGTQRAKDIPIIAMTANVFREDIEKCLASGMNGHVGKPLEMKELMAVMKKYLPS